MKLVIGNKNYSSWSLRPWLLLSHFNIEFDEIIESLRAQQLSQRLGQYSDSNKVPVLIDGELVVWDSLAICEYVNEAYLAGKGWPDSVAQRAKARALSAQMHSGFSALRNAMPMNCRARRVIDFSDAINSDIEQIEKIWSAQLAQHQGPWLFGEFSIADCMFAPVVMRFITYGVKVHPQAQRYMDTVVNSTAMKTWLAGAMQETEIVIEDEVGLDLHPQ